MPRGYVEVDGEKIRRLRKEKAALGLGELAAIVGIAPASLYQIEVRRQTTMPDTLRKIAKALRVKPAELSQGLEQEGVQAPVALAVRGAPTAR